MSIIDLVLVRRVDYDRPLQKTEELPSDGVTSGKVLLMLNREDSVKLVNWLYSKGVETIIYNGGNSYISQAIEEYKESYHFMGLPKNRKFKNFNDAAWINLVHDDVDNYYGSSFDFEWSRKTRATVILPESD